MYLIGDNSVRFPWKLPKDFPKDALSDENREKLLKFIDTYNEEFKFNRAEKLAFVILRILLPALGRFGHFSIRKAKFTALQRALYRNFSP